MKTVIIHITDVRYFIPFFLLWLNSVMSLCLGQDLLNNNSRLKIIDAENGLSSGSVSCILKDKHGYIWVGTYYGLNRYNGYNAKSFISDANDSATIPNNFITSLFEDNSGNLWIGTKNGLCRYDYLFDKFVRLTEVNPSGTKIGTKLLNEHIGTIFNGSKEKFYVGTMGGGLYYFRPSQEQLVPAVKDLSLSERKSLRISSGLFLSPDSVFIGTYDHGLYMYNEKTDKIKNFKFPGMEVNKILDEGGGKLWVATNNMGLYLFDKDSAYYEKVILKNSYGDPVPIIMDLAIDKGENNLLVATDGAGILTVNSSYNHSQVFDSKLSFPFKQLNNEGVRAVLTGKSGIIWIGTIGKGLQKYNPSINQFFFTDARDLSNTNVIDLYQGDNGDIWIGTDGGGLNQFSLKNPKIIPYNKKSNDIFFKRNDVIRRIFEDKDGDIWIGTYGNGISVFSPGNTKNHKTFFVGSAAHGPANASHVWSVETAGKNAVWVGTLGRGLYRVNKKSGIAESLNKIFPEAAKFMNPYILSLSVDNFGRLWIGTSNGVTRLSPDLKRFTTFLYDSLNNSGVGINAVTEIYHDNNGKTWLSTNGGGVVIIDESDNISILNTDNGLSHEKVYEVFQDKSNNYWIATYRGLNRYNPITGEILKLDARDGLNSSVIQTGICLNNGKILIGTPKGLNLFDPQKIEFNDTPPKVILEELYADNQKVEPGDKSGILKKSLPFTDRIEISSNVNSFSIHFVGLNYKTPGKDRYSYRLKGASDEWSLPSEHRWAQFNNLPPGQYILNVRTVNNNGKFSKGYASLGIKVLPPWYKTRMAFIIFILTLTILVFIYIRYSVFLIDMKRSLAFEKRERQRMEELNNVRVQFFTNISHEFRTPLTLISAPVEKLLTKVSFEPDIKKTLLTVQNNASYLSRLIDQVMDFSKLETGNMELQLETDDFATFCIRCANQLQGLIMDKNITFDIQNKLGKTVVRFDKNVVEKVIYNLLSNAVKYTRTGGKIDFIVFRKSNKAWDKEQILGIEVKDNGIGISKEDLKNLFTRFRQFSDPVQNFQKGTGIGLSLVKQLVELHGGKIKADSEINKGSRFIVYLPAYAPSAGKDPGIISPVVFNPGEKNFGEIYKSEKENLTIASKKNTSGIKKHRILIVEDNGDVLDLLTDILSDEYKIAGVKNGQEALNWLAIHDADAVISDVVMPYMDGIELCEKIKSNINYSHIPVILVSARNSARDKIGGVEHGADLYLSKPFNLELLKAYLKGILINREKVREFISTYLFEGESPDHNPSHIEEQFLHKVISIIKENIGNEYFSVEDLCEELSMSRSNLHRKLKATVGKNVTSFIRSFRLKEAANLLLNTDLQVSEIAYKVGFSNVSHFIKVFRQEFNTSPNLYRKSKTRFSTREPL